MVFLGVFSEEKGLKKTLGVTECGRSFGGGGGVPLFACFLRLAHLVGLLALSGAPIRAVAPRDTCQGFSTPLA